MQSIFSLVRTLVAVSCAVAFGVAISNSAQAKDGPWVQYWKLKEYKRPSQVPFPKDNRYTLARYTLGKMLFFDPRLSGSNITSCGSCHNPSFSWGDGLAKGVGAGMAELGRRTPTILNMAWGDAYFWDGRAGSLEEQALGPIQSAAEMNMPLEQMLEKIKAVDGYKPYFEKAYPKEGITKEAVAKAIATFERMVVSGRSPFDRWIAGDSRAVSTKAKLGFAVFNSKGNCAKCHAGWNFTDNSFHDIGLPGVDEGRGKVLPAVAAMRFAFKTPTLRNVALRGPYMHDGSVGTLRETVEMYDRGGEVKRDSLSSEIKPLNLTDAEKDQLVAFLETLTSSDAPVTLPELPR